MIEWSVCARPSLCVVVKKLETKWESIVLVLLYSGNNASEKKGKTQALKKIPKAREGGEREGLFLLV